MMKVRRGLVLMALFLTLDVFAGRLSSGPQASGDLVHMDRAGEELALVEEYRQLPDDVKARAEREALREGIELRPLLEELRRSGKPLHPVPDRKVFRVIQEALKPITLSGGKLLDAFGEPRAPAAAIPTGPAATLMLLRSLSVGRIELQGERRTHVGTGFVVGPGLVATNCHVLRAMASRRSDGQWELKSDPSGRRYQIDFGDARAHDPEREYAIESVVAYPRTRFLDVALLRAATRSSVGDHDLPMPIPLRTARMVRDWSREPLPVAVIGYPDLLNLSGDDTTQAVFRQIRESGDDYVKLLSPGFAVGLDPHDGIDFLDHVASTHAGESGSPVLDRSMGEAIGVHFCCALPGLPPTIDPLECSSEGVSDRTNNEAISTWSAASDPMLHGPLTAFSAAHAREYE
jgi:hypothetical protein